jgi:hypothetical protein
VGGVLLDLFPQDPQVMWGIIASLGFVAALGYLGRRDLRE